MGVGRCLLRARRRRRRRRRRRSWRRRMKRRRRGRTTWKSSSRWSCRMVRRGRSTGHVLCLCQPFPRSFSRALH
jgi:hypothetical protein